MPNPNSSAAVRDFSRYLGEIDRLDQRIAKIEGDIAKAQAELPALRQQREVYVAEVQKLYAEVGEIINGATTPGV